MDVTVGSAFPALRVIDCRSVALQKVSLQGGVSLELDQSTVAAGPSSTRIPSTMLQMWTA